MSSAVSGSRRTTTVATIVLLGGLLVAQTPGGVPGDPFAGVTPVEFEEFRIGLDDFLEVETSDEGLGPAYNGTSCGACHSVPAVGGTGHIAEVRAAKRGPRGEFVALDPSGETLFHLFSVPSHSCQPQIPADATVFARRVPIPLFGAGLVEAIPDESLLALEDPVDRNRDGVSGRAAIVVDVATGERRVGRFGWKAQHATLLTFGADAYRNEMGITNELFSQELAVGVSGDRMRVCDLIPEIEDKRDPRTGRRGIDNFASFMKFLAPVARGSDRRIRASRRTGVRRNRLRHMPHTVTANRAKRQSSLPSSSGPALLGSACFTTSGRATASRRAWPHRRRFGRRHSGDYVSAGPSCTMGRRRHSRKRSAVTRTRRSWRGGDTSARPKAIAPRCSRS